MGREQGGAVRANPRKVVGLVRTGSGESGQKKPRGSEEVDSKLLRRDNFRINAFFPYKSSVARGARHKLTLTL